MLGEGEDVAGSTGWLIPQSYLFPYLRLIHHPGQSFQEGGGGILQEPDSKDKALVFQHLPFELGDCL